MSEPGYILFFLIVFCLGWICGCKFILWRLEVERRRTEAFWNGRKQRVLRRA